MSKASGVRSTLEMEIVKLIHQKQARGINLLYEHYAASLFGIIVRIVKSQELAEEVLQDVFLKIWNNFHTYDSKKGRLYSWMSNIARNRSIDVLRSAQYKKEEKTDSIENNIAFNERLSTHMNIADSGLIRVINELDEKYSKLIFLAYFEGYSQRDIEKEFDIPLGTVKTRLRSAVNLLRSKLHKESANNLFLAITPIIFIIQLIDYFGY